jgi:uncharacterized membrane protein YkoI
MKLTIRKILALGVLVASVPAFAGRPPKDIISMAKASRIAINAAPGDIKSHELEFEMKQWVYSFDIQGHDNRTHEVLLNAKTGRVVSNKIETPAESAAEAKSDQAAASQTQGNP